MNDQAVVALFAFALVALIGACALWGGDGTMKATTALAILVCAAATLSLVVVMEVAA